MRSTTGIRLGISKDWNSKWYANKREYAQYLTADLKVREMLRKKLAQAGVSKIQIERPAKSARITIHTARPGVVIGKKGEDIEKLRKDVSKMMEAFRRINCEVQPDRCLAGGRVDCAAAQTPHRHRAMKRSVGQRHAPRCAPIKVRVGGRLNGAEIARSGGTAKVACRCVPCALTSGYGFAEEQRTTYRNHWYQGVDLQRRVRPARRRIRKRKEEGRDSAPRGERA